MNSPISSGFGLARVKAEGSPEHPDDWIWECDLTVCDACKARYDRQLKAYNDYWKEMNKNEQGDLFSGFPTES